MHSFVLSRDTLSALENRSEDAETGTNLTFKDQTSQVQMYTPDFPTAEFSLIFSRCISLLVPLSFCLFSLGIMSDLPIVPILDFVTHADVEQETLEGVAEVRCIDMHSDDEPLPEWTQSVEVLLCWHHFSGRVSREFVMEKFPRLRGIVRVGAGYDNVDVAALGELGIPVANVPDYGIEEVADSAVTLLLMLARKSHVLANRVANGEWPRSSEFRGALRLRNKTIGVIGFGRIGICFAMRMKAFGARVIFFDPYIADGLEKSLTIERADSLEEILSQSDILSFHCDLNKSSRCLLNAENMSLLRDGCLIVNTARGPVIGGKVGGAALDVLEVEPYTDGHLADVPNLIITPHSAFYSDESWAEMRRKAALEAKRVLEGKPMRNVVNARFLPASSSAH